MFKIPDWGEDVPKNNINLRKVVSIGSKKVKKKNTENTRKPNVILKTKFKATEKAKANIKTFKKKKGKLRTLNDNNVKNLKGNTSNKDLITNGGKKRETAINSVEVQNYDSDNLDELILNAKKRKLNATYQNEDNEENLFSESKTKTKQSAKSEKKTKVKIGHKLKITEDLNNSTKKRKKIKTLHNKDSNKDEKSITDLTQVSNEKPLHDSKKLDADEYKKIKLKKMLSEHNTRSQITVTGNKLRDRMMERLNAAKFRYLNEKLYTSSGSEAQKLFQSDPEAFQTYHQGYQQQVKKWPVNPLDVVVKRIQNMPKGHVIADMGCGEATLAKRVPHDVKSFDLVATAPGVVACDMARTPLLTESVDVAVYCLALMGTDLTQYLVEANRILKTGGHLLIAEVESRFPDVDAFTRDVQRLGFTLKKLDKTHKVFFFMDFTKVREAPVKKAKLPTLTLKPCIYKRR